MSRAVDCKTAAEVLVAERLAKLGSCVPLLERVTGFGARWARHLVKRNGGPLAYKSRDGRYFDADPNRRHNAWVAIVIYESRDQELSPGARLVESYSDYQTYANGPGALTINEFAEAVELYRTRQAQLRRCALCSEEHLVFTERPLCPLCQLMARTFCRCCGTQLADGVRHTTLYCPKCSSSPVRVSERRKARRRRTSPGGAGRSIAVSPGTANWWSSLGSESSG